MAVLASLWLIIETVIIPDGFSKWFFLGFFIQPLVLVVFQIFFWFRCLIKWLLVVILPPLKLFSYGCSCVCGTVIMIISYLSLLFAKSERNSLVMEEIEKSKTLANFQLNNIVSLHLCSSKETSRGKLMEFHANKSEFEEKAPMEEGSGSVLWRDQKMQEANFSPIEEISEFNDPYSEVFNYLSMADDASQKECSSSISRTSSAEYISENEHPQSVCDSDSSVTERSQTGTCIAEEESNSPIIDQDKIGTHMAEEQECDFYKKYTERMRWFDLLNYDRTCGISGILSKQLGVRSSSENIEPDDISLSFVSWNKVAGKKLLRSLESDFELVYVGQSCLSWEALHHQYRKVEALICSGSHCAVFNKSLAGEFQKFHVLLERFMEDERFEGKRVWNYVRRRFSPCSLLQVPEVSEYLEEGSQEMAGEAMDARHILKAIENCIQAFWLFVKADKKKTWWRIGSFTWKHPPVADPRDLEFLLHLSKRLRKNEMLLKDVRRKNKSWLKGGEVSREESQRKEMLFAMIDLKVVSRVLQMSTLSNQHLQWCQQKLDNMEFRGGKLTRLSSTGPLFPP